MPGLRHALFVRRWLNVVVLWISVVGFYNELAAQSSQQLGALFASAWSAGRLATLDEAVTRGLEVAAHPASLIWSSL